MSWAAHQFEVYAVEAHLPKKMQGQISWFAIFFGDFTPDFLAKFWVYGFNFQGHHYGASKPYQWHRGWPGRPLGIQAQERIATDAGQGRKQLPG